MLSKACLLFCVYYSPVWGKVCSLFVGVAVSGFSSKLQCEVGRIDLLPVEKEHLNISLQKLSTWKLCSETVNYPSPVVLYIQYTVVGTVFGLT